MIETEEFKMAESQTEALWERTRKATEERIKNIKDTLIIEEAFLKLCKDKLDEIQTNINLNETGG